MEKFIFWACNFIKKRLQHRCFPMKFAKFFRAPFFTEHLQWLILCSPLFQQFSENNCFRILKNTEAKGSMVTKGAKWIMEMFVILIFT